jgi:hypothetical protein
VRIERNEKKGRAGRSGASETAWFFLTRLRECGFIDTKENAMAETVLYQSPPSMFRNHPFKFIFLFALVIGCIVGLCMLKDPLLAGKIMLWTGIGFGVFMLFV